VPQSFPESAYSHSHAALSCETIEQLYLNICDKPPGITCTKFYSPGTCWLVVSHPQNLIHPMMGPLQNPRLCVACDGTLATYKFQVFFKTIESGPCDPDRVYMLAQQLLPSSSCVLCPGIQEYPPEICFKTKHFRQWGQPFGRLDADTCTMWHILNNSLQPPSSPLYNACKPCKQLHHDIEQLRRKNADLTEGKKLARIDVSSIYPMQYLSPASAQKRVSRLSKERKNLQAKIDALKLHQ